MMEKGEDAMRDWKVYPPAEAIDETERLRSCLHPVVADLVTASRTLLRVIDDYYDVDDGRPNIPGSVMDALETLRMAVIKVNLLDEVQKAMKGTS